MHETFPFFMREKIQAEVFCHLHVFRKHLPFLISERTVTQKIAQARTVSGLPFLIITNQVTAISSLVKHVRTYLRKYFFMPLFIKHFRMKENPLH